MSKSDVRIRAKKRALYLLERMDRTEQQLREKLKSSDYPEEVIEEAIEYVKSFHYLDDERYAENFTRYKKENMSRQQIKQKLMLKGVSKDIIQNAIEEEYDVVTVNGWVVLELDNLPKKNDKFETEIDGKIFKARVTKADDRKAIEINLTVKDKNEKE